MINLIVYRYLLESMDIYAGANLGDGPQIGADLCIVPESRNVLRTVAGSRTIGMNSVFRIYYSSWQPRKGHAVPFAE